MGEERDSELGDFVFVCIFLIFEVVTRKFARVKYYFSYMLYAMATNEWTPYWFSFLSLDDCRKDQLDGASINCRADQTNDASLSEEMLAMLYCMAIIR